MVLTASRPAWAPRTRSSSSPGTRLRRTLRAAPLPMRPRALMQRGWKMYVRLAAGMSWAFLRGCCLDCWIASPPAPANRQTPRCVRQSDNAIKIVGQRMARGGHASPSCAKGQKPKADVQASDMGTVALGKQRTGRRNLETNRPELHMAAGLVVCRAHRSARDTTERRKRACQPSPLPPVQLAPGGHVQLLRRTE